MNLNELHQHLNGLIEARKLHLPEVDRLMAIARALPVPQLPEALQTLKEQADCMAGELPADDADNRNLRFMAGALGLAARFKLPVSTVLPGYDDELMNRLGALLEGVQLGPSVPSIFKESK